MGEFSKTIGRLDAVVVLECVLHDLGRDEDGFVTAITKAARTSAGAGRVAQIRRVLETEASRDADE